MQELLGRIARLDPSASLGLRVIACFDELVIGNVNSRALLAAAASLAGCPAGFCFDQSDRSMRVTPRGDLAPDGDANASGSRTIANADGLSVWLERDGPALPNDAIILERLALAMRIRHGRGRSGPDNRRDLGLLVDGALTPEEHLRAAGALSLLTDRRHRIIAAPLFAVWTSHPAGAEDVVPTLHGPIHVIVVPEHVIEVNAWPAGIGAATTIEHLHHSFRSAMVALQLCELPEVPVVLADDYGGLISLLADTPDGAPHPDVERLEEVTRHVWGPTSIKAVIQSPSVRQAARLTQVHHSTMQMRVNVISQAMGFDPFDGFGKPRLAMAYLMWRLAHSRILELPAPATSAMRPPT